MKIYIASKYIEHRDINTKIFKKLIDNGFDVFLPESINIDGKTYQEMQQIAEQCYNAIDSCDVLLVVAPFGLSVAAEIGYAIYKKRKFSNTTIILFRYGNEGREKQDGEAMIVPFYDFFLSNVDFSIDSTSGKYEEDVLNKLISLVTLIKNK